MSKCHKEQKRHAVVVSEDSSQKNSWDVEPPLLCVGHSDTITFFIISNHTASEKVDITPDEAGFFCTAELKTTRNQSVSTMVQAPVNHQTEIRFNSGNSPTLEDPLVPTIKVKVTH